MQLLLVVIILLFLTLVPKLVSASPLRRGQKMYTHAHDFDIMFPALQIEYNEEQGMLLKETENVHDIICKIKSQSTFNEKESPKRCLRSFCLWKALHCVLNELTSMFYFQVTFE